MRDNTLKLLCALLLLSVSAHVVRADEPGQMYYANFYNTGGGWTTGTLLSSSPNSWKCGWPEVGPSGPLPDVYSWCTAEGSQLLYRPSERRLLRQRAQLRCVAAHQTYRKGIRMGSEGGLDGLP